MVAALVALSAAAPVMAFAASIEHDSYFALLFRFVMIPSTLFAGVFFPVDQLPQLVRPLAYLSPLWHGVELSRAATLGTSPRGRSGCTRDICCCAVRPGWPGRLPPSASDFRTETWFPCCWPPASPLPGWVR
ncbi:ABC transporter permease [Streptosporangium lutulentum]